MSLQFLNERLKGKRAFITGAASGLGAAFAKVLSNEGWTLHLADVNPRSLAEFIASLSSPTSIYAYTLDVAEKSNYEQVAAEVRKNAPAIDLLINNAGIGDGELIQKYDPVAWERMIQINLLGTYYGVHFLLPLLLNNEKGMIINIGSAAGFMNAPGMSAYNASKAAVYSLSETLYHELKPRSIHVSVATPSFFKTNIMSQASGSRRFIDFAEKQMKYSTTNASEMAEVVLHQAAKGKFQIIHPKEAKKNHFLKKWFPGRVAKHFEKMMAKFIS